MENTVSDVQTVRLYSDTVHDYISPVMTALAVVSKETDEQGAVAIVFSTIPRLARLRIARMVKSGFLIERHQRVSVRFDKLVLPRGVATGIVVLPKG